MTADLSCYRTAIQRKSHRPANSLCVTKLILVFIAALLLFPTLLLAEESGDGYDEHTIRPSDIPTDAPKFKNFPAEIHLGENVGLSFRSKVAREYRTRLSQWAKERPNFAGHYILATWGCGTNCTQIAIVDAKTGVAYSPAGASFNAADNVHDDLLQGSDLWHATGAVRFRADSRLLVLIGMPEERDNERGISYFVWESNRMKRIRFVAKP